MGAFHVNRAVNGAAMAPLSDAQKATICMRAREAFDAIQPEGVSFVDWRRDQQISAVNCESLTECHNEDYKVLIAHFKNLIPSQAGEALNAILEAESDPRRQALAVLRKECKAAEDIFPKGMEYVRGFLRNRRNCSLENADKKAIWHGIFTLRKKVQALRAKQKGGISAGASVDQILGNLGIALPKKPTTKKAVAPATTPRPATEQPW
jgi:hypothetical protein